MRADEAAPADEPKPSRKGARHGEGWRGRKRQRTRKERTARARSQRSQAERRSRGTATKEPKPRHAAQTEAERGARPKPQTRERDERSRYAGHERAAGATPPKGGQASAASRGAQRPKPTGARGERQRAEPPNDGLKDDAALCAPHYIYTRGTGWRSASSWLGMARLMARHTPYGRAELGCFVRRRVDAGGFVRAG